MKWLASALIASAILPSALQAKGLDKLQPDTEEPAKETGASSTDSDKVKSEKKSGEVDEAKDKTEPKGKLEKAKEKLKEIGDADEKAEAEKKAAETKEPVIPVEPGFQSMYIGSSLSLISVKGSSGSWHSSSTGDIEGGYRMLKAYRGAWDVYATFRYRPADVTVEKDQRAYRGVTQSYLFGAKGQMQIRPKLFAVASAELGLSQAELHPIDGIPQVDAGLEKSGVDLSIGGGVSYLVLDKIALGTQIHLGLGHFQSTQFGVDLRFLL